MTTVINEYSLPYDTKIELVQTSDGIKKQEETENYKSYLKFKNTQVQVNLKNDWTNTNNEWENATVNEIKNKCWYDLNGNITLVFSCWNSNQNRYNPCIIQLKDKYIQNGRDCYQVEFKLGSFYFYKGFNKWYINKARTIKDSDDYIIGFELLNNSNNKGMIFDIDCTNICYCIDYSCEKIKFSPSSTNYSSPLYSIDLSYGNNFIDTNSMAFIAIIGNGFDSLENSEINNKLVKEEYFKSLYHNNDLFLNGEIFDFVNHKFTTFRCLTLSNNSGYKLYVIPRNTLNSNLVCCKSGNEVIGYKLLGKFTSLNQQIWLRSENYEERIDVNPYDGIDDNGHTYCFPYNPTDADNKCLYDLDGNFAILFSCKCKVVIGNSFEYKFFPVSVIVRQNKQNNGEPDYDQKAGYKYTLDYQEGKIYVINNGETMLCDRLFECNFEDNNNCTFQRYSICNSSSYGDYGDYIITYNDSQDIGYKGFNKMVYFSKDFASFGVRIKTYNYYSNNNDFGFDNNFKLKYSSDSSLGIENEIESIAIVAIVGKGNSFFPYYTVNNNNNNNNNYPYLPFINEPILNPITGNDYYNKLKKPGENTSVFGN